MAVSRRKTKPRAHKILVVDDEPDVVTYLCTLLEEHGFMVCSAADGIEGLQKVRDEFPNLICLDILMPEKSGILMYEEMKVDSRLQEIPVLVVTGYKANEPLLQDFKRYLVEREVPIPEGYLEKPIDRTFFIQAVRKILRGEKVLSLD
jgi:CheY-like chemotaxis protein